MAELMSYYAFASHLPDGEARRSGRRLVQDVAVSARIYTRTKKARRVAGPVVRSQREPGAHCFVFLLSIAGAHFPSGPCMSIRKVYSLGEISLMTTRDLIFWPPMVASSV